MELKVVCYCGQKYKFDVEPVNGRVPHAVSCPACGADGTALANHLLTQQASAAVGDSPAATIAPAAAPVSIEPATIAVVPAASGIKLNINRPAPAAVPPLSATGSAPPPLSAPKSPAIKPLMKTPIDNPQEFSMGRGILGAFLGAAIGGGLVYGFYMMADFRFPLTGTAVGAFAGCGARWLARGTDSTLGIIAAAFALVSVVVAFFLMYGGFPVTGIIPIAVGGYFAYRIAG